MNTETPSSLAAKSSRTCTTLRIAAVGDLHMSVKPARQFRHSFLKAARNADILLLAGDLTNSGTPDEARVLAADVARLGVPVAAVLGNHDYASDRAEEVTEVLRDVGVRVLEGTGEVFTCRGVRLGIAGVKGFGGGFPGGVIAEYGEPETRAFARLGRVAAERLAQALANLDCDVKVALTHYAPTKDTLKGEDPQLYPVLGSEHLGKAIDSAAVALAIHGHAHRGTERGTTTGGTPVRNVAYRVIQTGHEVYAIGPDRRVTGGRA